MKIEVNYSFIKINDYNQGDCVKLESYFRTWNEAYHRVEYKHIRFDKDEHCLYLPRGMDIWLIEKLLGCKACYIQKPSPIAYNDKIGMKFPPRDAKQKETLKFLTGSQEYRPYKDYTQYLVALSPGVGKTYVTTAYIAMMGMKALVISYNLSDQWYERIGQYTDIRPQEVYNIQGMPSINSLMRKTPEELSKYKIYLATHDTLKSLIASKGAKALTELIAHLGIGIKVFDEAHKQFENMCTLDYLCNTAKTIYLTATPVRNDAQENNIYMTYFKNVPKISLFDESDKHVKYLAIKYSSSPNLRDMDKCMSKYGFNRNSYANYAVQQDEFYALIFAIIDICNKMKGKKLIYLASNHAIEVLYNWLTTDIRFWYLWDKVGIYSSINKNKQAALDKEIILTTSGSAGEGLDVPGLICGVNLADPTSSEPLNRQRFERVRARGYFLDVVDEGFKPIVRYYYANQKIYSNFALSTQQTTFKKPALKRAAYEHGLNHLIPGSVLFGKCRKEIEREKDNGETK